jgi:hypothetical protein
MVRMARGLLVGILLNQCLYAFTFLLGGSQMYKFYLEARANNKSIQGWIKLCIELIEISFLTMTLMTHSFECLVINHIINSERGTSVEEMMVVDYSSGKVQSYQMSFKSREKKLRIGYFIVSLSVTLLNILSHSLPHL